MMVTPRFTFLQSSCDFTLRFADSSPRQLAVHAITYRGYAYLENAGVEARVVPAIDVHNGAFGQVLPELHAVGPHDDLLTGRWTLPTGDDEDWTACLLSAAITGRVHQALYNPFSQGNGALNLPTLMDATVITFDLLSRACGPTSSGGAASTPSATSTSTGTPIPPQSEPSDVSPTPDPPLPAAPAKL